MQHTYKLEHKYTPRVHILKDSVINTFLTRLSQPQCTQPEFNRYVEYIYQRLFDLAITDLWPKEKVTVPTRMTEIHPGMKYDGDILAQNQKAALVDIARAGMLPTYVGFTRLCEMVNPEGVRMDHIYASRATDNKGKVTHTHMSGSKIGGDIADRLVFLADPMGATGNSLSTVISHYKDAGLGTPKNWVAIHLIVTPEYLKKMTQDHPDVEIYAARVDRGMSAKDVLNSVPGTYWDKEFGLNDKQYIVPGAGGVGELINNSFV